MRKIWMSILPVLALALVLNGCQAISGETLGQNVDDTTITTTVKTKLAAEKGSSLTRVSVDTNRGVVHLTGVVTSPADKTKAEQVARSVGGVKNVVNTCRSSDRLTTKNCSTFLARVPAQESGAIK